MQVGDIAFTRLNVSGRDGFSFVALVDIAAGAKILFSSLYWDNTKWLNDSAGSSAGGIIEWTAPGAGVAAGGVVNIDTAGNTTTLAASTGTVQIATPPAGMVGTLEWNLRGAQDSVLAFTGTAATPSFIAGITSEYNSTYDLSTGWIDTAKPYSPSVSGSELPTSLTNGANALAVFNASNTLEFDNVRYKGSALTSGTKEQLMASINNWANWEWADTTEWASPATSAFTVGVANTAPTLTAINTLTGATEDTAYTITYSALLAASNAADADGNTLSFRVETLSSGTVTKGGVPVTAGTLVGPGESLVWLPPANANGTLSAFTVKAWDGTVASASAVQVAVNAAAVNDAPTLSGGPYALTGTNEDTASSATLVSTLLAGVTHADVDSAAVGIAVISTSSHGAWQYSTNGSTGWTNFGALSNSSALLLSETTYVRYAPDTANGETATLTFRAWDKSAGTASANSVPRTLDATSTGGSTALSSGTATANLTVTSVNDAPTNITLSNNAVAENVGAGVLRSVGTLTTTDVDTGDAFTYSFAGGADDGLFQIVGNELRFKDTTTLNYEAKTSYAVTVRSTDSGALSTDKAFTVNLTDVNEAPTVATPLADQATLATQAFNFTFASNAFQDVDAATTLTYTATLDTGAALPGWLTFTPGTRSFSGTPAVGDAGTLQVKVTASDGSLTVSDIFALVINAGPTVTSINRVGGSATTNATSVNFTVTFSESVTGVDMGDFTATMGAGVTGAVTGITGSGSTYTATVGGITGDGTLRLDLKSSGTGIQNGLSTPILGDFTAGQVYTVDHTAPAAPSMPVLSAASDTGSSNSDLITSATTPTVTGTAESGVNVTLYDTDSTTVLGSTTADGAGNWSITSIALAAGTHTLTTKASDVAGNFSTASLNTVLTIDPNAPVFASAIVNGNSLVLTYTDAGTLDAVNVPPPGAFTVLKGAVPNVVTAVAVNAASRTVTLTLTTAVANGDALTVAYNDPTGGNDANALQDAAGNDAATLAATAVVNSTPAPDPGTPPTPPGTPIDGVPVTTEPGPGGSTIITIPVVVPTRPDTPGTPSPLADIPLVTSPSGTPIVSVGVPTGVGLQAEGLTTTTTGSAALAELGFRIERIAGDNAELTNAGQVFYATLAPNEPLSVQILKPTIGAGYDGSQPLVITGSTNPADGKQAVIVDARSLPAGTVIQVDNIEFIAVVGNVRLVGGAGQNAASGDGAAQWIVLGPDDDIIHGGGGNDVVGSEAGDDQVFGDAGDDIVFGGAGNDLLSGGTGSDRLNGGTGFDVAIQEGARSDYTVTLDGAGIKLTHTASGVSDWLVDVEQVRFATGPSLTVAHSAAEEATAYLVQKFLGRDLTQSEGAVIQTLAGTSGLEVARLFAQLFPEQTAGRTPAQLLEGMAGAGIIRVDAIREITVTGDAGNNTITPTLGLARYVDGGAGIDTVVIPATLGQTYVQSQNNGSFTLQRLTDGAMLDITSVERVTLSDTKLALDLAGHAGEAARLLGALGGPAILANKGLVGEVIRALDAGTTSQVLAGIGLQALGANTPTQIAQTLWTNVVGRAGTDSELKILTDIMASGASAADLVVMAAHLDATAARIDLVGLAAKGLEFA